MREIKLTAFVRQEDGWFVAQALEVDVASQGESPHIALDNLAEALELHFEPPADYGAASSSLTTDLSRVGLRLGGPAV